MTVANQIANLTTAVDGLAATVAVKRAVLDAAVSDAQAARGETQVARDQAALHKQSAAASAAKAASDAAALAGFDLAAIDATLAEEAVAIFVYDTSADSDGGAWRHRCQATSWFNEPLNTSTRGGRRDFPAVAVIVIEAERAVIYDADDPALPMWMIFPMNKGALVGLDTAYLSCGAMLNGKLCIGHLEGLGIVDFAADTLARGHVVQNNVTGTFSGGIAARNIRDAVSGGWPRYPLVDQTVNDVDMVALPGAPRRGQRPRRPDHRCGS